MKKTIFFLLLFNNNFFAQKVDITSALQEIESGNIQKAEAVLKELKIKNPNDPSVIFLDAVLTKSGEEALKKYSIIYEKFPHSNYADAALYRIFSYYYSLGYYKRADSYLTKLKTEFPDSPYLKTADRSLPDTDEPIQIAEQEQTENKNNVNYKFTIQAGAFLTTDNARNLSELLKKDGYLTEITTKEVGGSILNIVNVGKFLKEDEVQPVLDHLEKKYNLKGRVIQINN